MCDSESQRKKTLKISGVCIWAPLRMFTPSTRAGYFPMASEGSPEDIDIGLSNGPLVAILSCDVHPQHS